MASGPTKNFFDGVGKKVDASSGRALRDYLDRVGVQIIAAGMEDKVTAHQLLGMQVVGSFAVPFVALFIMLNSGGLFDFMLKGPVQLLTYILLIAFGFYFPLQYVRDSMKKRQKKLTLALPDTMDLLTLSVEAGLDFMGALRKVVTKMPEGPLREEMQYFFKQVEVGRTRREALKELANRTQLQDLSNVCSSLIQADRLGTSVGPVLRVQSDMLRVRRGQRAEKAAMEAPVKMLAPLLLCIFPAVFIVIFAPLFIQMFQDLTRK